MPYEFICPHCGGRSYSAAANAAQPCPHCGQPIEPPGSDDDVDAPRDAQSDRS